MVKYFRLQFECKNNFFFFTPSRNTLTLAIYILKIQVQSSPGLKEYKQDYSISVSLIS